MKTGSLRRSIALPDDGIAAHYSPDGLNETDIDALLAQEGFEYEEPDDEQDAQIVPFWTDEQNTHVDEVGGEAA